MKEIIYEFLSKNENQFFTAKEIIRECNYGSPVGVYYALQALVRDEAIVKYFSRPYRWGIQ